MQINLFSINQRLRITSSEDSIVFICLTKVDVDPCPDCGHHNVMVMDTAEEFNDYNQQIEDNNKTLISQYNYRTVTDTERANTKKHV